MPAPIQVEVCVESVESAQAAERGGAHRIELCSDLLEGGLTPSAGMIQAVREQISLPVQVMIRPRAGDFFYGERELDVMRRDIAMARTLGADGVVFGILDVAGNIDVLHTRDLVEFARPLSVTFHRAFDMSHDLVRGLHDVCSTGADRLLTSGGEQTCLEGAGMIASLVREAGDRIVVIAGSGIRPENAVDVVHQTGVREIHVGLSTPRDSPMRHRNDRISMGKLSGREYLRSGVLESTVRTLTRAFEP